MNEDYNKGEIVNNIFSENKSLKLEIRKLKKELAIKAVEINDLKEKNCDLNEMNKNFGQSEQKFFYQLKNVLINSLQKEKDEESEKLDKKVYYQKKR